MTVRDGLLAALPKADIHFTADLNRALQLADEAEVVIVVAGEGAYAEMHGDNLEPSLNQADKDLIKALSAEGKRIVLVLIGGRPSDHRHCGSGRCHPCLLSGHRGRQRSG